MIDDVGRHEQTVSSARLVKVFANTHKYWQGLLQLGKNKSGRFRQLDSQPNQEVRQHAAAPYSTDVFTHDGLPLGGLNRTTVGCFVVG